MDNQGKMNETAASSGIGNAPVPGGANSVQAGRPFPVTRSTDATSVPPRVAPRKGAPSKKKGVPRRPEGTKSSTGKRPKGARPTAGKRPSKRPLNKSRFSRKQIIIGLIALIFIFDMGVMSIWYFGNKSGPAVPPNSNPYALIQSQMGNNHSIAEVGYDSALTFANYTNLEIVNTASLKPIENNLLKSGGAPDGADSLYDEQIVGRVLKFNSDWTAYLNRAEQTVFSSVQEGSVAQTKVAELGAGSLVAYHRIAIGEIRRSGKNYYLITQASYTLTKNGQLEIHDELFVYKLVARGATMLIVDFEQIPVGSLQGQPTNTPDGGASTDGTVVEPTDGATGVEGDSAPPADGQGGDEASPPVETPVG